MDTKPQKPIKLYNYHVAYILADGNTQDYIATAGAQETAVFQALQKLNGAVAPTGSVSEIRIKIGNKKDTA